MHRSSWVMFHPMKLCTAWDSPVQHRHSELFSIHMNEFSLSIQMRSYHTELCIVKLVNFANLWLSCIYWDSHELWSQHISGINSIINCPFSTSDLFELRNQYQEVEHLLETYSIASWWCEINFLSITCLHLQQIERLPIHKRTLTGVKSKTAVCIYIRNKWLHQCQQG